MIKLSLRTLAIGLVAVGTLASCGGSDVDTAAARIVKGGEEEKVKMDKACVTDVVKTLSAEDVKILVDAEDGSDPTLSDDGEAKKVGLAECLDKGDFVKLMMDQIPDDGSFDRDCMQKAFDKMEISDIMAASESAEAPAEMVEAMTSCVAAG
jgi:hypothetical protein